MMPASPARLSVNAASAHKKEAAPDNNQPAFALCFLPLALHPLVGRNGVLLIGSFLIISAIIISV